MKPRKRVRPWVFGLLVALGFAAFQVSIVISGRFEYRGQVIRVEESPVMFWTSFGLVSLYPAVIVVLTAWESWRADRVELRVKEASHASGRLVVQGRCPSRTLRVGDRFFWACESTKAGDSAAAPVAVDLEVESIDAWGLPIGELAVDLGAEVVLFGEGTVHAGGILGGRRVFKIT